MKQFDFGIIGFGIAGLSVAYALRKSEIFRGASICVISGGEGLPPPASHTPIALLNPATGREAKLVRDAAEVLPYTKHMLREIQDWAFGNTLNMNTMDLFEAPFFFETGVLRPAASPEMANAIKHRLETDPWPNDWASWLSSSEIADRFAGVYNAHGGLWISEGGFVNMTRFFEVARKWLEVEGVVVEDRVLGDGVHDIHDGHNLEQKTLGELTFRRLILTAGHGMTSLSLWQPDELGLHAVKGQILTLELSEAINLSCAVSMHGYLAPHVDGIQSSRSARKITIGSTFEHQFDSIQPNENGQRRLLEIAESILPGIGSNIIRTENWASIRVHRPPDRKPFVARQYSERGIWGLTGFGSKGLLLAPTAARRLVTELEEQDRATLS